jgi:PiT family inorganic phosphate transporter
MARGIEAIDLAVVGRIMLSWIVTIPAGAILSIIFFLIMKATLG